MYKGVNGNMHYRTLSDLISQKDGYIKDLQVAWVHEKQCEWGLRCCYVKSELLQFVHKCLVQKWTHDFEDKCHLAGWWSPLGHLPQFYVQNSMTGKHILEEKWCGLLSFCGFILHELISDPYFKHNHWPKFVFCLSKASMQLPQFFGSGLAEINETGISCWDKSCLFDHIDL